MCETDVVVKSKTNVVVKSKTNVVVKSKTDVVVKSKTDVVVIIVHHRIYNTEISRGTCSRAAPLRHKRTVIAMSYA